MRVKAVGTDTLTKYNKVLKPYKDSSKEQTFEKKHSILSEEFLIRLAKSYVIEPKKTYIDVDKLSMSNVDEVIIHKTK